MMRPRFIALVVAVAAIVYWGFAIAHLLYNRPQDGIYPFSSNFNTPNSEAWHQAVTLETCCEDSLRVVAEPGGDNRVLEVNLRRDDPKVKGSKRAELRLPAVRLGEEFVYDFRIKVPATWLARGAPVTVAQWHEVPDRFLLEGAGRSPPVRLIAAKDRWVIVLQWDTARVSKLLVLPATPQDGKVLWQGPLETNRWIHWRFKIKWSIDQEGTLEIIKDDTTIVSYRGPNCYNDFFAPYFKIGLYVPHWASGKEGTDEPNSRQIYVDDVLVWRPSDPPAPSLPNKP